MLKNQNCPTTTERLSNPDGTLMRRVFGKDATARKLASPINHACAGAPPFLIIYSESELPGCEGAGAEAFCKALRDRTCAAATFEASLLRERGEDEERFLFHVKYAKSLEGSGKSPVPD